MSTSAAWAAAAAAGTQVIVSMDAAYAGEAPSLVVHNPSADTAITVRPQVQETLNGVARWAQVGADLSAPANATTRLALPAGLRDGEAARLLLLNASLTVGAFTAYLRARG